MMQKKKKKREFTVRGGLSFGKRMARPFLQEKGQLVRVTVNLGIESDSCS